MNIDISKSYNDCKPFLIHFLWDWQIVWCFWYGLAIIKQWLSFFLSWLASCREMYLGALFVMQQTGTNNEITSKRTAGVQKWWISDHLHLSSDSASAIPSLSAKWLCSPRYHTVASLSFTISFSMSPDFVSPTYNENWIVQIGKDCNDQHWIEL